MTAPDVQRDSLLGRIYDINEKHFEGVALEVWKYQHDYNPLYRQYCDLLNIDPEAIRSVADIPFFPVAIFRQHHVRTASWEPEKIFKSSGTTGSLQSQHLVRDLSWYHSIAERAFHASFTTPSEFTWIGLLPSYLDRADSSLVDMVHHFMQCSNKAGNQFFPQITDDLVKALDVLCELNQPTVLIGVSFALLDLFDRTDIPVWDQLVVIETGGMKGRGKEITRDELYQRFKMHYPSLRVASEYGMTELLSQAYLAGDRFKPGPAMKAYIRDISDPLRLIGHGQRGVINIIDLANVDTCSFIATDDVGIHYADGSFDVLGRLDDSDLRGCNLMYV